MRNADNDREIIAAATEGPWEVVNIGDIHIAKGYRYESGKHIAHWIADMDIQEEDEEEQVFSDAEFIVEARQALPHWLERAVSAEQRVAELESTLRRMMKILEPDARPYRPEAYAYHEAVKALKGLESEDRGE